MANRTNRTNSAGFLEPSQIQAYLKRLQKEGASPATLKRKEAALKNIQSWQEKEYGPKYPLPKGAPKPKRITSKGISPKIFPPFLKYFSFLIGLVLLAGLGWGVYSQFFAQPKETPSMALPTNPPLLISFQGQLTDEVGLPLIPTVSATFVQSHGVHSDRPRSDTSLTTGHEKKALKAQGWSVLDAPPATRRGAGEGRASIAGAISRAAFRPPELLHSSRWQPANSRPSGPEVGGMVSESGRSRHHGTSGDVQSVPRPAFRSSSPSNSTGTSGTVSYTHLTLPTIYSV